MRSLSRLKFLNSINVIVPTTKKHESLKWLDCGSKDVLEVHFICFGKIQPRFLLPMKLFQHVLSELVIAWLQCIVI